MSQETTQAERGTEVHTVGCEKCGDFYATRHKGRAIGVLNGMKRRDGHARMHGNGTVEDHSHDGLAVVTLSESTVEDLPMFGGVDR